MIYDKKKKTLCLKKTVLNNGKHEFVVYHSCTDSYYSSFVWKTEIGFDPWRYVFLSRAIRQHFPQVQGLAYMYGKWLKCLYHQNVIFHLTAITWPLIPLF